jgi:hypothetical protein
LMKPIRCLKKEILTKYVSSRSLREAIGVGRNFCINLALTLSFVYRVACPALSMSPHLKERGQATLPDH